MSVQAMISIAYTAESAAAVEEAVAALALPEGANVSASVTEVVVSGVVDGGTVSPLEPGAPTPPPAEEKTPPTGETP